MKHFYITLLLLTLPLSSLFAQSGGYIKFSEPEITPDAALGSMEAEFVFVCNRNDIVINNTFSIDRVEAYPKSRNGRYEYTVHLQLKASNGDFQRDRTFVFGIKNTSITEEFRKKSIMGGRRYTVGVDVVDQFIEMIDRTPEISAYLSETEACVIFRSLLELDIRATDSRLARVSRSKNSSGLNEYEVVIPIAQLNEGSSLFVSAHGKNTNVLALDVSELKKKDKKVYEIIPLRSAHDESSNGTTTIRQQYVVIQVEPKTSIVTFNGEVLPVTDGAAQKLVPFGTYEYKVECADYHTKTGTLRVDDPDNTVMLSVGLKANYGWIDVEGSSAEGASVYIDKYLVGTAPYHSDIISSGRHSVMIMKPRYKSFEQTVEVRDGEHTRLTPTLDADFATVTFVVAKNADIYIDGKMVGRARVKDDFPTGYHTVETYLEGCRPQSKIYNITSDMMGQTITLPTPAPICGILSLSTVPLGAEIIIDGKSYGRTPKVINSMEVGEYAVTLSLAGYETFKTRVTVQENEQTKIETGLTAASSKSPRKAADKDNGTIATQRNTTPNVMEKYNLTVNTNMFNAQIFLDGAMVGRGKTTTLVPVGEHVIEIKVTGYQTYTEVIQMNGAMTKNVTLQKEEELYDVEIRCDAPDARVYVDSRPVKNNGGKIYPMSAGRHIITVTANHHSPYFDTIDVTYDTVINVRMQRFASSHDMTTVKVGNVSFNMVYVKGGQFRMGSNLSNDEQPVHNVELDSYYIAETEVTQELWKAVMHDVSNKVIWSNRIGVGDDYPAYGVSYKDAKAFVKQLSKLTGRNFRLPTEAEWEYAAKGGASSMNYRYSGSNTLSDVACHSTDTVNPVRSRYSNELGLYDMSGNVWEWCNDWYSSNYYSVSPTKNPEGPVMGTIKVMRGGCWSNGENACRVAHRDYMQQSSPNTYVGIRLVMEP